MPQGDLEHHLAIVSTWVDLALAISEAADLKLLAAKPDWELRGTAAVGWAMVPDLLLRLTVSSHPVWLSVEVDLGTERLPVLEKKLIAYAQARLAGQPPFDAETVGVVVACAGATKRRITGIRQSVERIWLGWGLTWEIGSGPEVVTKALSKTFRPPLTASPCCKGSGALVSHEDLSGCGPRDGGPFHNGDPTAAAGRNSE